MIPSDIRIMANMGSTDTQHLARAARSHSRGFGVRGWEKLRVGADTAALGVISRGRRSNGQALETRDGRVVLVVQPAAHDEVAKEVHFVPRCVFPCGLLGYGFGPLEPHASVGRIEVVVMHGESVDQTHGFEAICGTLRYQFCVVLIHQVTRQIIGLSTMKLWVERDRIVHTKRVRSSLEGNLAKVSKGNHLDISGNLTASPISCALMQSVYFWRSLKAGQLSPANKRSRTSLSSRPMVFILLMRDTSETI